VVVVPRAFVPEFVVVDVSAVSDVSFVPEVGSCGVFHASSPE